MTNQEDETILVLTLYMKEKLFSGDEDHRSKRNASCRGVSKNNF